MSDSLKIAIIGDYNFTYNSHHATNLALDHSSIFLNLEINYYWIKISEAVQYKISHFDQYDGVWIAPGPYQNLFYLSGIFKNLLHLKKPVLITGDAYKPFFEYIITQNQLNPNGEKLISDNLIHGNHFERVTINPCSKLFKKLYENFSNIELTSSRFSLYPQLIEALTEKLLDIEAYNQFEEPEIVSLRHYSFFLLCAFCPQISSTRDLPHPIIYTFLKVAAPFPLTEID
jgi:CTP synthase (UTP-ammonia lyase)